MSRWCALLLLVIAIGLAPVAQALPCLLHTSAASAPCPHENGVVPKVTNRVADCFMQAAPLPDMAGGIPQLPAFGLATVPVSLVTFTQAFTAPLPHTAAQPPPRDALAWFGQRRI